MIKYKTEVSFGAPKPKIWKAEVERETKSYVYINGRRTGKMTEWDQYHDTWEDAHNFLIDTAEKRRTSAKKRFDAAMDKLAEIRCMLPDREGE